MADEGYRERSGAVEGIRFLEKGEKGRNSLIKI